MQNKLIQKKLSVRKSYLQGYGVFAEENIAKGEVIEECCVLFTDMFDRALRNYAFTTGRFFGLALGFGSLYNHALDPNASHVYDSVRQLLVLTAQRPIVKGEEIYIHYGDEWFSSREMPIKKLSLWRKFWRFFSGVPLRGLVIIGLIYLLILYVKANLHAFVQWLFH